MSQVGTGVYLEALPSPPRLLLSGEGLETGKRDEYQSRLSSAHTHYTRLFEVEQTRTVADQACFVTSVACLILIQCGLRIWCVDLCRAV